MVQAVPLETSETHGWPGGEARQPFFLSRALPKYRPSMEGPLPNDFRISEAFSQMAAIR